MRAVAGEPVGTRFHPQARRESSFKLWLKYAKARRGTVLVDQGAERALREQGTSLLPVGVVEVEGDFEAGDAVEVAAAADGRRPSARDLELLGRGAAPREGPEVGRRCARCCPARARRPCTATTSCWPERGTPPLPFSEWPIADTDRRRDLRAGEARLARAGDARRRDQGRARCGRSRRARGARRRDPRGERRRPRGRPRRRPDAALLDRLALTRSASRRWPPACATIVALPDPVGEELESRTLYNGLELRKVRVPLGVVAIVYEARPNVTVDAAALAIKSGNAVVLRGSSTAERSNAVLARIVADTVEAAGLPAGLGVADRRRGPRRPARAGAPGRLRRPVIPRGGEALKKALKDERDGAGHLRGGRQLPRLRRRHRRRRDGPAHRLQRQGAAARRLQRGRDAARARRRRARPCSPG